MKRMITKAAVVVLACAMLAGCSSNSKKSRDRDDDDTDKTEESREVETDATTTETSETTEHTEKPEPTTTTTEMTTTETTADTAAPTGDYSGKTLEEVLNLPEFKKEFDDQINSLKNNSTYSSMYSDIKWKAEGNSLIYEYYYAQNYTKDQIKQIKSSIDSQKKTLTDAIASAKDGIENAIGVRPDKIGYAYFTKDGTEIIRIEA